MARKKFFSKKMKSKLMVTWILFMICFTGLAIRVAYIHLQKGDKYANRVLAQQSYDSKALPYKRGSILDTNGAILAYSKLTYNVVIEPKNILYREKYVEPTIKALVKFFEINELEVRAVLEEKPESKYVVIKKNVDYKQGQAYKDYKAEDKDKKIIKEAANVVGIYLEEEYVRKYPNGTMACDVIGFVSQGNVGNGGLEGYYNEQLNGTNGRQFGFLNSNNVLERKTINPEHGNTLVTTLDSYVQGVVEKYVKREQKESGGKNVGAIVMNPNSGEIYAMASYPVFDLNDPYDLSKIYSRSRLRAMSEEERLDALYSLWNNFCITDAYEPGSTSKVLTEAIAFEEARITGREVYNCTGVREVQGGDPIRCNNSTAHGSGLTAKSGLAKSCNLVMTDIVNRIGRDKLLQYQNAFGLGQKSGIDLPGEASGILTKKENLNVRELASNSFGQNFTANMVQMISAYSAAVNGGYYYEPHLVKQIQKDNGATVKQVNKEVVSQVISNKTSSILNEYLQEVVATGTGKSGAIRGYKLGGKTGTAQKVPYRLGKHVISFIGSVPADNPELVIYTVIDEPNAGVDVVNSAPTIRMAKNILEEILPYMNIYPQ